MKKRIFSAAAASAMVGLIHAALGNDPFQITAQSTSGPPITSTGVGSNLPNLLSDLIKDNGAFSSLQNVSSTASLRYGTENNAILVDKNAAGTSATVSIPSIGFTKNFTAANSRDLEKQIENFAKKEGADIYGKFIQSVNQRTTLGVTDGNPLAATALFANQPYVQFGLQPSPAQPGQAPANPLDQVATSNFRLDFDGGYSHTDIGSGYYATGAASLGFKFGQSVGLVFTTPFEYRYIAGATAYDIGEEVSLPVVIIPPRGQSGLSWMVTPTVFAGGAGSVDLASGGLFLGGGLTSSLSLQFAGFIFTLGDELNYVHGFPVTIGAYKFDTRLEQEVAKNGVKITRYFGNNLYIDGGITYSQFCKRPPSGNIGRRRQEWA